MATEAPPTIEVTVVFSATPRAVQEIVVNMPCGSVASDAVELVALQWGVALAQLQVLELGVWGKRVPAQQILSEGDRLEMYRPLTVDPKVARRERFVRQGAKSAGLFAKRRAGGKAGY
jgi:putative ubiquitin-RnfH superfamily antitoxin RatB of RatAB toxin-antitoxin module